MNYEDELTRLKAYCLNLILFNNDDFRRFRIAAGHVARNKELNYEVYCYILLKTLDKYGSFKKNYSIETISDNSDIKLSNKSDSSKHVVKVQIVDKTNEHREKVRSGEFKIRYKSDITPDLVYETVENFGNRKEAAEYLGISTATLNRRLREYKNK